MRLGTPVLHATKGDAGAEPFKLHRFGLQWPSAAAHFGSGSLLHALHSQSVIARPQHHESSAMGTQWRPNSDAPELPDLGSPPKSWRLIFTSSFAYNGARLSWAFAGEYIGRRRILHTDEVGGSSPLPPTRCQNYNVWPDQAPFRVTARSGMFVSLFKPGGGCATEVQVPSGPLALSFRQRFPRSALGSSCVPLGVARSADAR